MHHGCWVTTSAQSTIWFARTPLPSYLTPQFLLRDILSFFLTLLIHSHRHTQRTHTPHRIAPPTCSPLSHPTPFIQRVPVFHFF